MRAMQTAQNAAKRSARKAEALQGKSSEQLIDADKAKRGAKEAKKVQKKQKQQQKKKADNKPSQPASSVPDEPQNKSKEEAKQPSSSSSSSSASPDSKAFDPKAIAKEWGWHYMEDCKLAPSGKAWVLHRYKLTMIPGYLPAEFLLADATPETYEKLQATRDLHHYTTLGRQGTLIAAIFAWRLDAAAVKRLQAGLEVTFQIGLKNLLDGNTPDKELIMASSTADGVEVVKL